MDRIKEQVDQIQQQLAGLSVSQKMLTATLVAIMIATVVWWTRYAATGEMVPVIDQALTADDKNPMTAVLDQRGIAYVMDGDRLLVSASDRERAFSVISSNRALPRDTTNHFAKAVNGIGAFDSNAKVQQALRVALQDELSASIAAWDNIRFANVLISTEYKRQIRGDILPRASINIETDGRANAKEIAASAAHMVKGAVAMMSLEDITVTVDRMMVKLDGENDFLAGGNHYLALSREGSQHYADRVRELLVHIRGLRVAVDVEVNDKVSEKLEYQVDTQTMIIPRRESSTSETSTDGRTGGEPGLGVNMGLTAGGPSAGRTETTEKSETESIGDYGRSTGRTEQGAGATTPTTCSLSIPFSYILQEWQKWNGDESRPDASVLQAYEQQILEELKDQVSMALGGIDVTQIACKTYYDGGLAGAGRADPAGGPGGLPGGEGEKSAISGLIRHYGKEAAVAALAMVSLFLVSTMVKKSAPLSMHAGSSLEGESFAFDGSDELAGVAAGTGGLMVAQEVSDDAVQAGQVLEQVQTLVKENPDAAAALVKRWLNAG